MPTVNFNLLSVHRNIFEKNRRCRSIRLKARGRSCYNAAVIPKFVTAFLLIRIGYFGAGATIRAT